MLKICIRLWNLQKNHTIKFAKIGNENTKSFNYDEFLNHIVF